MEGSYCESSRPRERLISGKFQLGLIEGPERRKDLRIVSRWAVRNQLALGTLTLAYAKDLRRGRNTEPVAFYCLLSCVLELAPREGDRNFNARGYNRIWCSYSQRTIGDLLCLYIQQCFGIYNGTTALQPPTFTV